VKTALCEMLGVEFPLLAFSHCRDVVAAVSKAGGFGVLGGSTFAPEQLKVELDWIDAHVDGKPYGLDLAIPENMPNRDQLKMTNSSVMAQIPEQHKRFVADLLSAHGVNPDTRVALDDDVANPFYLDTAEQLVDEGLRHPIRLLVNALGVPPQFLLDRAHAKGVAVGALVGSKDHALRQIKAGVDVLVAQGTEAAAHCGEVSTMVIVPEVVRAVQKVRDVPVLAAGGIVTGRQMAAAMAMGAAGVWTGSVWLPTIESHIPQAMREKIIAARSRDTLRSRALSGKTSRQLRSAWNEAWEGPNSPGFLPFQHQMLMAGRSMQQIAKSIEGGNAAAIALITDGVGQGIGMIDSVKSVRTVVREFMEDFAEATERLKALVE
jgi:NAD(P)H-dependent flavin oxidoreductase YrpB (nitropropane dioxygenase family)